ncbi:MAG: RNA ligase family protein [Ottowia sp.]|nr:RNA ligase family protein [Ottowia sp.]
MEGIVNAKLLSRDAFREGVFARDGGKCVLCDRPAADAHHILERRLFDDGGYYLDNGASVCAEHHLLCEQTVISVEAVREAAGITRIVLPEHLYEVQIDKWANEVLPNGQRLRGELWHDESVQKVLAAGGVLGLFTNKVKYGRTHHLPWSEGMHDDDRMLKSLAAFVGHEVCITRKMDGENTTMMRDCFHARSIDGRHHGSRDWAKGLWASIAQDIPEDWRVCGENLFAKHSIAYADLPTYFMGFSIWNERNVCLSWDETLEWFDLLGLQHVPVLYRGVWDEKLIRGLYDSKRDWGAHEGYVVRRADSFSYAQFRTHVGKFVRKGHVNTSKHWMFGSRIERNGLASR